MHDQDQIRSRSEKADLRIVNLEGYFIILSLLILSYTLSHDNPTRYMYHLIVFPWVPSNELCRT